MNIHKTVYVLMAMTRGGASHELKIVIHVETALGNEKLLFSIFSINFRGAFIFAGWSIKFFVRRELRWSNKYDGEEIIE